MIFQNANLARHIWFWKVSDGHRRDVHTWSRGAEAAAYGPVVHFVIIVVWTFAVGVSIKERWILQGAWDRVQRSDNLR
jgi:hypothetical protein